MRTDRDHEDAKAMLTAAYVLGRRSDEQRPKRTFVTQLLIKVLQNCAAKWTT